MGTREVLESYVQAWNAHDPREVAAHFAPNGVRLWQVVMNPLIGGDTRFSGREAIAAGVKAFIDALPDLTVQPLMVAETGEGGVLEWRVIGTHTGAWGGWTGQGEPVDLPGVSVYRLAGDEIVEERMYFDPDVMAANWVPPQG